jgi:hypothetical protein
MNGFFTRADRLRGIMARRYLTESWKIHRYFATIFNVAKPSLTVDIFEAITFILPIDGNITNFSILTNHFAFVNKSQLGEFILVLKLDSPHLMYVQHLSLMLISH